MRFRANKELLISRKGIIQKGKWDLLDIANIIIDMGDRTYLFNASYVEDELLALQLDGTEQYMVMIGPKLKEELLLISLQTIEGYLEERYNEFDNHDFIAKPTVATSKKQEYDSTDDILGILKLLGIGCIIVFLVYLFAI